MKRVLLFLLMAFIIIQFFRVEQSNPEPTPQLDFLRIKNTPGKTANLIRNSCYDCHSNETNYPWYTKIQPFGWLMQNHIENGRKELNFSTFATYDTKRQLHKLEEAIEMIENDEMPLDSYLLGHPEAKLSAEEKKQLISYLQLVRQDTKLMYEIPRGVEQSDFKIQ